MTTYISPGVYTVEQDLSSYVSDLSSTIVGMVGTADSGPTNTPILITTANDFVTTFGNVNPQHYLGYAALSYLEQGSMLWVTRVTASDASFATNAMLLPSNYTQYQGKWILSGQTSTNVTYTLYNAVGSTGANATVVLPATTPIPGFDPTDYTNTANANGKMGSDLFTLVSTPVGAPLGYTSPLLGVPLTITTGAGKNTIAPISGVGTASTQPTVTVPLSAFVSTNSPATAFAVGTIALIPGATEPSPATNLITIASYGTSPINPITLVAGAANNTLYNKALATYNNAPSGTLQITDLESLFTIPAFTLPALPASVSITIPLFDTSADTTNVTTGKNLIMINSILTVLLQMVNLGTAPVGTNSAVFYNHCRVLVPSTGLYGIGAISVAGTSQGFSALATPTIDASGNVISVNLVSLLPGLAGTYLYSAQTPAIDATVVVAGGQCLGGTFSLAAFRPTWSMVQAGTSYVPTVLKFTSLGETDDSNTDITLSMDVSDQTADNNQNYTLRVYQRISSTNVSPTSQTITDFGLVESYYGTIEGIQSQMITSSRIARMKIDYSTVDIINMTTGLATDYGDNLAFDPMLLVSETNAGISVGTHYDYSSTSGSTKVLDAPLLNGSIGSAVTSYNIVGDGVSTGLYSFANADVIDINVLLAPGWSADPIVSTAMVSICETRGDSIAVLDTPFGLTVQEVIAYRKNIANINSSYAAMYYPWVKIADSVNQKNVFVPPSGQVVAQYAYNDHVADVYYAPAGINRGMLTNALSTERLLAQGDRDALALANINPIVNEPAYGIYIKGQYTLQTATTALNRVNVRRMLLNLRKVVATASVAFEFQPADSTTALRLKQVADGLLSAQLYNGAVQSYTIDVGPDVNTPIVFANNQLMMRISVVPTLTAEVIVETFTILPQSGAVSVTTT